ncbi:B12-binding domain-containing radical SAM protein [Fluviispira multicolorata]|uniref:Radical SAM protein n=1 Tax=Fluviispira multicolorata TaxID=2654512 RepID=A0A833JAH8_9BACT|nr:radical SAM protein [Fluviispira multicolorata]KAB8027996.1 radical SAM protein [Fluviispira multicolorata]
MDAVLINPNLIFQRSDPFTTGIVYMPISLAYVAASLRHAGFQISVIDAFAEKPKQSLTFEKYTRMGLYVEEVFERIPKNTIFVFIYAINLSNHDSICDITKYIKTRKPEIIITVLENTQAVTAYQLEKIAHELYDIGVDFTISGEGDYRAVQFLKSIKNGRNENELAKIDGLGCRNFSSPPIGKIKNLDDLPFPAWDLFPLKNYWKMHFAHGPQTRKRYMPLLTSRGCPYSCAFCVVPATNNRKWRPRSPINIVTEIEYYIKQYQVKEFHIEDLDPTIDDKRIREFCQIIIQKKLSIAWKIVAGTKVETIKNEETVDLMAKAGCTYVSISPETGSPELLKTMLKPFDLDHAINMIKKMNQVNIKTQACFVLGFPGEKDSDRILTKKMIKNLTKSGIDEIALFIVTPVPGSRIYNKLSGYNTLSELNFSPTWRDDYKKLNKFRLHLYFCFILWKIIYHPKKILIQALNFFFRRFQTKMEMVPYRAIVLRLLWGR